MSINTYSVCEFIITNIYIHSIINDELACAHIIKELHIINNLKVNIFLRINVLMSKQMIINLSASCVIIKSCDNLYTFLYLNIYNVNVIIIIVSKNDKLISLKMLIKKLLLTCFCK